jgi:GTPase SAR1 family protein
LTKEAFNFELVDIAHYKVAIWDIPGRESLRILWPNFYRTIEFSGVMFFIDYENKDKLPEGKINFIHSLSCSS